MSSHPTKKQRLEDNDDHASNDDALATVVNLLASFGALSVDELANILGYLKVEEIMRSRCINKKSREAVKITIVPYSMDSLDPTDFEIDSAKNYNAMRVMTRAMPNLQQITLCRLNRGHKWSDGEDPDEEEATWNANETSHDIGIISNFSKLRRLEIQDAELNGRYPVLFNSFPLLQKLWIQECNNLKWDLEMLAGFPMLKELHCVLNFKGMAGNINSLRVLKDTLESVEIFSCDHVEGNLMDLADLPHLKVLNLCHSAVKGDIRDIGENDFSSLEELKLPSGVYGGIGYKLQRISDGPDVVRAVYLLKKQRPAMKMEDWSASLSGDSPDWYEPMEEEDTLPFCIRFLQAGPRIGYRWTNEYGGIPCEVNWLDQEPDRESSEYSKYIEELEQINSEVYMFRGFHQPPTEEEYHTLWEEYIGGYADF